jgi:hypothetical protein
MGFDMHYLSWSMTSSDHQNYSNTTSAAKRTIKLIQIKLNYSSSSNWIEQRVDHNHFAINEMICKYGGG